MQGFTFSSLCAADKVSVGWEDMQLYCSRKQEKYCHVLDFISVRYFFGSINL